MAFKNLKSMNDFSRRRHQRRSLQGSQMVLRVKELLEKATESGRPLFVKVVRGEKSFTVYKLVDGQLCKVSFGISISQQYAEEKSHLYFPFEMTDKRIIKRVDDLFKGENVEVVSVSVSEWLSIEEGERAIEHLRQVRKIGPNSMREPFMAGG